MGTFISVKCHCYYYFKKKKTLLFSTAKKSIRGKLIVTWSKTRNRSLASGAQHNENLQMKKEKKITDFFPCLMHSLGKKKSFLIFVLFNYFRKRFDFTSSPWNMEHGQFVVCFITSYSFFWFFFFIYSLILHRIRIPDLMIIFYSFCSSFFLQLAWAFLTFWIFFYNSLERRNTERFVIGKINE